MSDRKERAKNIVQKMYENDAFSQWLGIERLEVEAGSCVLRMVVRDEMLNGFDLAHGGITYALADSALAFASNGHGKHSLSIDTQISHLAACRSGDTILAVAKEIQRSKSLARYDIDLTNQDEELVAHFRGTVNIKDVDWEV